MIWWTKSWNPVVGCTKCSPACANCYAETLHTQRHKALLAGKKQAECYRKPFGQVQFLPERLLDPLRWRGKQRVFTVNMGDPFHPDVTDAQLDQIVGIMACCWQHTFHLLTKRWERMHDYFAGLDAEPDVADRLAGAVYTATRSQDAECHAANSINNLLATSHNVGWPMRNLCLGATIWGQPSADRAVPILLSTPAAKHFVSVEPMLGPVDLTHVRTASGITWDTLADGTDAEGLAIDWVICGGETGPGARPMHPDWPRRLRDQCQAAGVPFFFKQWGEWWEYPYPNAKSFIVPKGNGSGRKMYRVGSRRAGRVLDGRTWEEIPNG